MINKDCDGGHGTARPTVPEAVREYLVRIAARGGSSTSEAKRAASAENGRKGGRPPGKKKNLTAKNAKSTKKKGKQ